MVMLLNTLGNVLVKYGMRHVGVLDPVQSTILTSNCCGEWIG
jgi:hypothetical protein